MNYFRVKWHHADEPIEIYSELDPQGWETRKVELFSNGQATFASANQRSGDSGLAEVPWPSLTEIERQAEFQVTPINQVEFEQVWKMAVTYGIAVYVTVERELVTQLGNLAWQRGLSVEKLVNGWLYERLEQEKVLA